MGCNTSKEALAPVLNENGEGKAPSSGKKADAPEGQDNTVGKFKRFYGNIKFCISWLSVPVLGVKLADESI